jgi:branched-chain amino acid transport system substrate-binding protein
MKRLCRSAAVALVAALVAAISAASAQTAEPIHVGVILSYTGLSAPLGGPQVKALKIAEADINDHGGINGRKIAFDIVDDEAKPDVAARRKCWARTSPPFSVGRGPPPARLPPG